MRRPVLFYRVLRGLGTDADKGASDTVVCVTEDNERRNPKSKTARNIMTYTYPSPLFNGEGNASALDSLGLTRRETEVLTWIAQGKTNYEIGVILSACTGTICKHVQRILVKLSVENRTAAAAIALEKLADVRK
jgi:DNA-binding NarL/FixJ family response regulator